MSFLFSNSQMHSNLSTIDVLGGRNFMMSLRVGIRPHAASNRMKAKQMAATLLQPILSESTDARSFNIRICASSSVSSYWLLASRISSINSTSVLSFINCSTSYKCELLQQNTMLIVLIAWHVSAS